MAESNSVMRCELKEDDIKSGKMVSIRRQYSRKEQEFQRPCVAMMSGCMPSNNSSVAPPIQKV
jgi:hypothetical protein